MNIAIVIPVYREAGALPELLDRFFAVCARQAYDAEVVLVDDGSGNDTWQRLIALRQAHAQRRILLLRLAENRGQQAATICGLMHCHAMIAVTLDADLQHPPEEIPRLLEALAAGDLDLVYGLPARRQHPLPRRAASLAFRLLTRPLGTTAVAGSSFRALRTAITADLPAAIRRPYVSLDAFVRQRTSRIGSITVEHAPRRLGASSYTWKALLATAFKEVHYSGRSAIPYLALGLLALLTGGLGILLPGNGALAPSRALGLPGLLAGLGLVLAGLRRLRAEARPGGPPLFVVAGRVE